MKMKLPQEFCERMQEMLGKEYPAFFASYDQEEYKALRLNPLKAATEQLPPAMGEMLTGQVPWCETGYYYPLSEHPGKHPYHEAGVYYIQEPSAMAPAEYLDVHPGTRVLDVRAALGGKSTQIAGKMGGERLRICNEIHPARAKILSENIERMGIPNAVVLNETPQRLSEVFEGYFHRIMVDAPCSGEGMFRKNQEAVEEWSPENVKKCALRQDEILEEVYHMLAPGGRMVYSTCTFAPEEDEGSVTRFLERHPDMRILPVPMYHGMESGNREGTIRLWPHKLHGEGHFLAVLEKEDPWDQGQDIETWLPGECRNGEEKGISLKSCKEYQQFAAENLKSMPEGVLVTYGDQLYLLPKQSPSFQGLKVLRPGLHLGTNKKNRFEPSHALALALRPEDVKHTADLKLQEDREKVYGYLRGETFSYEGEKGWYLVTVDGYSMGWGKLASGTMKNHYPKGLRKNLE